MRKIFTGLIISAAVAALAGSAFAADLPVKVPPVAYPVLTNWGGWYVGANAGYSWGHSSIGYAQGPGNVFGITNPGDALALSTSLSPDSFIGGGQFGFNYQAGVWVLGFETDIAWRDRTSSVAMTLNTLGDTLTLSDEQKWVGTVRGRLGFTPATMSNWLFYVTGGLAYGDFEHSATQFCNVGCTQTRIISDSVTKAGWTVGGGVEVALNRNWSLGAEYLYMDFGTDTLVGAPAGTLPPFGSTFTSTTVSFHDKSQVARLKLNYRFADWMH